MTTSIPRAAASTSCSRRSRRSQHPKRGRRESVEVYSARVPFRLKLVLVWALILGALVALFAAADFDTDWMRENAGFIARGDHLDDPDRGALDRTRLRAGAPRRARAARSERGRGRRHELLHLVLSGTPLIVQLFLIYLALPQIGIGLGDPWADLLTLDVITAGVIALGLNYGAYMTEIFRAGIQSVGHGQSEAAEALGMTYVQKTRRIVLRRPSA